MSRVGRGISVGKEQNMEVSLHVVIPVPKEIHNTRAAIDSRPSGYTDRKEKSLLLLY